MKGRLEHEIKIKDNIKMLLDSLPGYVSDYYYNMQISKEPTTCLEYLREIKRFLDFCECDIIMVDDKIVGKYFEKINYKYTNDGVIEKTSFSYRKKTWTVLNQFFKYMKKKNIITCNPMDDTDRPSKKDKVNRIFLSIDDLNKILQSVKIGVGSQKAIAKQREWVDRDLLILFLFMNTGMRRTALSEINLNDINFIEKKLVVTDKRDKEQVYVITEEMEVAINNWLKKREELLKGEQNDALFISSMRTRMTGKAIYNIVQKYSKDALGYEISPHKLRSSFVSLYYEKSGRDIKATCEAVGHEDISTTNMYIVKENNSRKDAQNFMSKNLIL